MDYTSPEAPVAPRRCEEGVRVTRRWCGERSMMQMMRIRKKNEKRRRKGRGKGKEKKKVRGV
jgi:hypothetical protein